MTQLNFDEKGNLVPQKICFEVKHNENAKERLKNIELEKEVLRGLDVFKANGVDIKTLTIWCNPNRVRGPDYQVKEKILLILKKLIAEKKATTKKLAAKKNQLIFYLINSKKG